MPARKKQPVRRKKAAKKKKKVTAAPSVHEGHVPKELTDKNRGKRLQRVLAEMGIASRRDCEQLIIEGHIKVNGKPVTALPAWVDPEKDRIAIDGEDLREKKQRNVYVMLDKPRNVISTTRDPEGRKRVTDLIDLPKSLPQRLFPVGRLDADSTGFILMTNDGDLANRLTHPRYEVPKQYEVSIKGKLTEADVERLRKGLYLTRNTKSTKAKPARKVKLSQVERVSYQRDKTRGDRTQLIITLLEGHNREIRRMLARLGFKVRRLRRIAIGPVKLKGIASGQWRMLTAAEVKRLRKAAGYDN